MWISTCSTAVRGNFENIAEIKFEEREKGLEKFRIEALEILSV